MEPERQRIEIPPLLADLPEVIAGIPDKQLPDPPAHGLVALRDRPPLSFPRRTSTEFVPEAAHHDFGLLVCGIRTKR